MVDDAHGSREAHCISTPKSQNNRLVLSPPVQFQEQENVDPADPELPPDGGANAWMIVLCSHFVVMNTWGFSNSFGAFQTYLVDELGRKPSDISWIGSMQTFLLFFLGTLTGRYTDAGYFRPVFWVGTISTLAGVFASSFCSQYWHFFLTLGLAVGIGNGCLFCPMLTVMSTYFDKRRAIAIGIVACGSATGGTVYLSLVRQLIPSVGFSWTMRVIGFIQLVLLIAANVWLRPRIAPRKLGPLVDWMALKEIPYMFYMIASFFSLLGLYFSFFFLASFSRTIINPPFTYPESLNLLLLLNGISVIGRLGSGYLADRVGTITIFIPVALATSMLLFAWAAVHDTTGTYVWAAVCGMTSGGVQSLFPAALSSLTPDMRKRGIRIGMVFSVVSFASLIGPPVGGALISSMNGRYLAAQLFAGSCMLLCAGFLMAAQCVNRKSYRQS